MFKSVMILSLISMLAGCATAPSESTPVSQSHLRVTKIFVVGQMASLSDAAIDRFNRSFNSELHKCGIAEQAMYADIASEDKDAFLAKAADKEKTAYADARLDMVADQNGGGDTHYNLKLSELPNRHAVWNRDIDLPASLDDKEALQISRNIIAQLRDAKIIETCVK